MGDLGPVRVGELSQRRPGGPGARRGTSAGTIASWCKVEVIARGRGVVAQDGREASLGPGDLTLVDLSRPARWSMSPVRCVAVAFPRALLPLSPDELARLTAVRVPGDRGPGAPASAFALRLAGQLGEAGGARLGTPWSTCSRSRSRPVSGGGTRCRPPRAGVSRCCACTRSSRRGSATRS
jgi:AraC-binding-like domain